jgi:PAS domain-containing protein
MVLLLLGVSISSEAQVTGLECGADGHMVKPIPNKEFLGRVQSMVRIKEAEDALQKAHDELDRHVVERTAEISWTNDLLTQEIERRKKTEEAFDLEHKKLESILRLMNDSVCIVDQDCNVQYSNPAMERQFAGQAEEHKYNSRSLSRYCQENSFTPCHKCDDGHIYKPTTHSN